MYNNTNIQQKTKKFIFVGCIFLQNNKLGQIKKSMERIHSTD